ncbi:MAG: hypothetical protein GYB37_04055 [Algicola sp.]|nr:hypothetical protein [Algicola sp.]
MVSHHIVKGGVHGTNSYTGNQERRSTRPVYEGAPIFSSLLNDVVFPP